MSRLISICNQIHNLFSAQEEQGAFQARYLPSFLSSVFHMRHYFLFDTDALYAVLFVCLFDCCSSP